MARRPLSLETILTHLGVAAAVLLVSLVMAGGPLGLGSQASPPHPAGEPASLAAEPAPVVEARAAQPELQGRPEGVLPPPVSSRGGRVESEAGRLPLPSVAAAPDVAAAPAATAATPTAVTATTVVAPAAVPTPQPFRAALDADDLSPIPEKRSGDVELQPANSGTAPSSIPTPVTSVPSHTSMPAPPSPIAVPVLPSPTAVAKPALSGLRVGIQAGHWKNAELPAELASLRGSTGAQGSGWKEVDVNLDIAGRVAALLKERGIAVDLLPATVPVAYKADAFVSIHCDANSDLALSGYKLARARWSKIPQKEDSLLGAVSKEYALATGLKVHASTITENMRQYYAFDFQDFQHAVASTTPSVILELGFLTTLGDRKLLMDQPGRVADGIARGIVSFLGGS